MATVDMKEKYMQILGLSEGFTIEDLESHRYMMARELSAKIPHRAIEIEEAYKELLSYKLGLDYSDSLLGRDMTDREFEVYRDSYLEGFKNKYNKVPNIKSKQELIDELHDVMDTTTIYYKGLKTEKKENFREGIRTFYEEYEKKASNFIKHYFKCLKEERKDIVPVISAIEKDFAASVLDKSLFAICYGANECIKLDNNNKKIVINEVDRKYSEQLYYYHSQDCLRPYCILNEEEKNSGMVQEENARNIYVENEISKMEEVMVEEILQKVLLSSSAVAEAKDDLSKLASSQFEELDDDLIYSLSEEYSKKANDINSSTLKQSVMNKVHYASTYKDFNQIKSLINSEETRGFAK